MLTHPIPPLYAPDARILILGSFPSVASREAAFFYGHKQNRFWRVLAALFAEELPTTVEEKTDFVLRHRIALWDVIASCEITGSSDSSIRNVVPSDITPILRETQISAIFTNGGKASALYRKYQEKETGIAAHPLPSTSPANASMNLDALCRAWSAILEPLK